MPSDVLLSRRQKRNEMKVHLRHATVDICGNLPSPLSSFSLSAWEVALSWIINCVVNHKSCGQTNLRSARKLPSRLIAVGEKDDFSDIRLCETIEFEVGWQYVTLSHRWPLNGFSFKLSEETYNEFLKNIPWNQTPQTFKDAIIATRKLQASLGIRYLWIDTLCIIQDSEEDKKRELGIMGDIYSYSFLNLAACTDSDYGLSAKRDKLSSHTCIIKVGPQSQLPQGYYAVENMDDHRTEVVQSELTSRGWVQQEFLLARRLLIFTPQQLFWECACFCASEKRPGTMIPPTLARSRLKEKSFDNPDLWMQHPGSEERDFQFYRLWMNIVGAYTACNLTNPEDKLVAISGMAKQMKRGIEERDSYLCGLWTRRLELQLLWRVQEGHRRKRQEDTQRFKYIAPTWSWASVNGRVYNHRTNREAWEKTQPMVKIEILDRPHYENNFGRLRPPPYAALAITGLLLKVQMEARLKPEPGFVHRFTHLTWHRLQFTETPVYLDLDTPGDNVIDVYCLPIVKEEYTAGTQLVCLILKREGSIPGLYMRCGQLPWLRHWQHEFISVAKSTKLSESGYHAAHEDGQVTILLA